MALFLGGAAASSCRRRHEDAAPTWTGAFADGALADGHRLRDGFRPPPAQEIEDVPVLIIGAGAAGLSAAWELTRSGQRRFIVLELEDEPGGTSSSGRTEVSAFPWGAHYLPAPSARNTDLVELLEETKTVIGKDSAGEPIYDESQLCAAPKERVFYGGLWHGGLIPRAALTSDDTRELARFEHMIDGFIAARDESGRRAFAIPVAESSSDERFRRFDGLSMAELLDRERFMSPFVRWSVRYACRDDFGTEPENTSAWYGLHYFCARTEASGEESAEFLTWPEGNGFLIAHLAARIGTERILKSTMAISVRPDGDGRRARVDAWDRAHRRARAFRAEQVILATPSFLRSRLLADWPKVRGYDVRAAPWLVANIHLSAVPASNGYPLAWDNVIFGSRSLGYVDATHQTLRRPVGPSVWTYYLPLSGEDERQERAKLEQLSWAEASSLAAEELARCHIGLETCIERIDVKRWGHGMVRPLSGRAFSSERALAAEPCGPIHFAHTDLSGVALFEEAFFHGVRAAREVARALSG